MNMRSINPSASGSVRWKLSDLKSHILKERDKNHCFPFIALTETWLKSYISDAQMELPGYSVTRCDRDKRIGGGVLLYSQENIPVTDSSHYDDGICQVLFCKFETTKTCVGIVYRPPKTQAGSFSDALQFLSSQIENIADDSYQLMITGDFNMAEIDWHTSLVRPGSPSDVVECSKLLFAFMSSHLLNQYITIPTRGVNTLELFLTNDSNLVTNVTSKETHLSDHNIVDVMLSHNPAEPDCLKSPVFDENEFRSLDFHNADFEVIKEKLDGVNWIDIRSGCSFEDFPKIFTETLFQICKESVPVKKIPSGRPRHLNALRRKKKKLEARLNALQNNNGHPAHIKSLKTDLALVHYDIKEAINKNLDFKEQKAVSKIKSNPKYFYSYAMSLSKTKSSINMLFDKNKNVTTDNKSMADTLQEQFQSVFSDPQAPHKKEPSFTPPDISAPMMDTDLDITNEDIIDAIKAIPNDSSCGPDGIPVLLLKNCASQLCAPFKLIWSESFKSGTVPKFYKNTQIFPLFKKGDRARAVNYRPIALTSHVIKIYERVLRAKIVKFVEDNDILCNNQHGFRRGRSCLTQLLSHFEDIMFGLTQGADTDAIYLDFAKAFDKVDHQLLIQKLRLYGFHEQLIKWLESFLSNRSQHVVVNGFSSFLAVVISGVPQGTVLGPLLFIMFINDMSLCINHSIIRFFADDTRILKHIFNENHVAELQEDLDHVIEWATHNNMSLHEDKFELIVHKHAHKSTLYELPFIAELLTYKISNGDSITPVNQLKDLGVIVSSDLSWSAHVNTIASRARSIAAWVLSAFKTRDRTTMLTLYKSLVRSHLEYCCPLWNPHKIGDIEQLESVQRTFTSRIWGVQHLSYWERLKALNLMSLQRRRERYMVIHMWKILHGHCPNDINVQFAKHSRHGVKALVPVLSRSSSQRNQNIYDHSFSVTAPHLWNIIPISLHGVGDLELFKHQLTDFFKCIPDNPPVSGYNRCNNNSVVEWYNSKTVEIPSRWFGHQMA